ncbi:oxysterol-binding protein-related protein 6-like isoform X9 [Carassius carassius]|uniref:oxysterol-binding protein-related protein 6-like isoform X9 n=1 Tax=Carassius carassius TaxID=217509 RepID=UPI002868EECD|nr:oxysterol-binding protein-related protein 6-like isoform X9 [Carassius carassius]
MSRHQSRAASLEEKGATPIHKSSTPSHKSSTPTHKSASSSSSSQRDSRQESDSWEIIEGLRIGQTHVQKPEKHEGFMLKKRKWPLKGWHKRFFVLDNGILKYSKSPVDIQKGKLHGNIDVGLSVMSIKKRARRIDLDTEEHIYHLKVKSPDVFDIWVCKLRHHRLFRQNEIVRSPRDATLRTFPPSASAESPQNTSSSAHQNKQGKPSTLPWQLTASCSNGQSKVAAWLQESEEMDKCSEELAYCQSSLLELSQLLQSLESLHRTQSAPNFTDMQVPLSASMSQVRLHSSNPNLCAELADFQTPVTRLTDSIDSASDYIKLQEDFCIIAQKVHALLKSAFNTVAIEKEKIKQVLLEQEQTGQSNLIITLRRSLSQALSQNAELKTHLNRINSESVLSEPVVSVNIISSPDEEDELLHVGIPISQQVANESRLSMSESVSEFFDAQEVLLSASSSENEASDDESYISDVSDNISEDNASVTDNVSRQMPNGDLASGAFRNGRRTCLPAPAPDTSNINLWNILKNNIGKDLSKVSMPVELNEPLNTLQHMCEELEYTELLDKAAHTDDPYERMAIVAAFAVSGYSSTYYRAGSKPFNPLLAETYECIREDKGFCFFSEQVSHHPPISACHCESQNFTFWQDVRWKNKFWGKSMEILPIGTVNVMLPSSYGDHYEWNKVTTCVHNILSGRRWIEHYGEVTIRNTRNTTCICKLTFVKGNYWSSNLYEVHGSVMEQEGKVIHRLFGKWHEGLYCGVPPSAKCIWRPGSMPTDYELYYGFSRFAIELNELCPELKELLPPTDARYRPDQRCLEEGNVQMAAAEKQRIEEQQRNRRKWLEENNIRHQPRFFKKVMHSHQRERWVSNNKYWELRKDPGFLKLENPELW